MTKSADEMPRTLVKNGIKSDTYGFSFIGYNHEALRRVLTDPKNIAALTNRTAMGKIFIQAVHCTVLKYRKNASINTCYKYKKYFFLSKSHVT